MKAGNVFGLALNLVLLVVFPHANAQWVRQYAVAPENLVDVAILDSAVAIAVGDRNGILMTTDAGETWENQSLPVSAVYDWKAISFFDRLNGVIVGSHRIQTTTDGGMGWRVRTVPSNQECFSVFCLGPASFYVGADSGWIYFTSDTGVNWTSRKISGGPIIKIFPWTGGYVGIWQTPLYALTPYSVCSRSLSPGSHEWTEDTLAQFRIVSSWAFDAGYCAGGGPGFIVGVGGDFISTPVVLRKFPGDIEWQWAGTGINGTGMLFGVSAPSAEVVYVCGTGGMIYRSSDGGDTWLNQSVSGARNVRAISFLDEKNGFAVGDSGLILHTSTGGVTRIVDRMPPRPRFALGQNYPNPFNPATVVGYQISEVSYVSLKVYDVLGREVATLVSGKESAGVHDVTFDAGRLPSGVYFYRLEAGGFTSTRKMILLK